MSTDLKNIDNNLNISETFNRKTDLILIDIYQYLYGDTLSCTLYYVVLVSILLVGPLLCLTIVFYEHFGLDRQKRTILNRLSSHIFSNIAINSFIWSLLRILRDNIGLLKHQVITPVALFSAGIWLSSTLFITELTVFRFLYIVVWKRLKAINDDFWNCILVLSNVLIAIYICVGIHLTGSHGYDTGYIIEVIHTTEDNRYVTILASLLGTGFKKYI